MIYWGFHLWRAIPKHYHATKEEAMVEAKTWLAGLQARYPGLVYRFRPDPDDPDHEDEIIDAYYADRSWRAYVASYANTGEDE